MRVFLLLVLAACARSPSVAPPATPHWPEFAARPDAPVLLVHYLTHCPILRRSLPTLQKISDDFPLLEVVFFESGEVSERELFAEATADWRRPPAFVSDRSFLRARALKATVAGEVFLFNSRRLGAALVYRGAIDDGASFDHKSRAPQRHYLREALGAQARGEAPAVAEVPALGCSLEIP